MPTNSNIMSAAIVRACWQDEDQGGMQAARPWLRWLLTRVVGMTIIPTRESDRIQASRKQWLSVRKEQGLKIDPDTAEVFWKYGPSCDPYDLYDLTYEDPTIGRNYFARSPGSDVWVYIYDLPEAACDRLWARLTGPTLPKRFRPILTGDKQTS
jgi:hypothetical protein